MMFTRVFNKPKSSSFFLFGARGTGKSTLLRQLFAEGESVWFDLLDPDLAARFERTPSALESELARLEPRSAVRWVVIDEIQKVPPLLDVVHRLIEKKRFRFALTGSSARKLKRGGANLLAGRAIQNFLFPMTHLELGDAFDLDLTLRWGSLPTIFALEDSERADYLRTYVQTYLREEVAVEQLVRKLPPFRAFLECAAQGNGKIVNYSNIARDIGSDPVSVKNYYGILEDTLLGFFLEPWHGSIRKRQRQSPKFYFFDTGVASALRAELSVPVRPSSYAYGDLFEQFVIGEIFRLNHYHRKDWRLSYLRTKDDAEIDLVIERPGRAAALVEIKSTERSDLLELGAFSALASDVPKSKAYCLSRDARARVEGNITFLEWRAGIAELLNS